MGRSRAALITAYICILSSAAAASAAFAQTAPAPVPLRIDSVKPTTAAPNTSVTLYLNRSLLPPPPDTGAYAAESDFYEWVYVTLGSKRAEIIRTDTRHIQIILPNDIVEGRPEVVIYEGGGRSPAARYSGLTISNPRPSWVLYLALAIAGMLVIVVVVVWYARKWSRNADKRQQALLQQVQDLRFRLEQGETSARQVSASNDARKPSAGDVSPSPAPEPPVELVHRCAGQEAVLVAGFGVGAHAGLPTWREALDRLIGDAQTDESIRDEMRVALGEGRSRVVAELLSTRLDRASIEERIREMFLGSAPRPLPDWYHRLGRIQFTSVLTYGWDDLPERAFAHRGGTVVASSELEEPGRVVSELDFYLLKLNGDPTRPNTLRFTEDEYRNFLADTPTYVKLLETLVTSRTLFFLGVSLYNVDVFFSTLNLRGSLSRSAKTHFALVPFEQDWEIQRGRMMDKYGVHLIGYQPSPGYPQFTEFIDRLSQKVAEIAPAEPRKLRDSSKLSRVVLTNIGPFRSLTLDLAEGWNVLLGINGSGKSTILKAIALGLCGNDDAAQGAAARLLRAGEHTGCIELTVGTRTFHTELVRDRERVVFRTRGLTPLQTGNWVVLGFPPLRGISVGPLEGPGRSQRPNPVVGDLLPLITDKVDSRLDDVRQWLINLEVNSTPSETIGPAEAERNAKLRQDFFAALRRLSPGVTLEPMPLDRNAWEVQVRTADGVVPITSVSQGMSSLFGWVGTLLQRMYEIYSDSPEPTAESALVMVDEIDAHLHPRWQFDLVEAVKDCFPRLQVIATTHSPLVVSGMLASEVLITERSLDPDEGVRVRQASEDADGLRADQILASDLFGLTATRKEVSLKRWTELMRKDERTSAEEQELAELHNRLRRNGVGGSTPEEIAAERERRERLLGSISVPALVGEYASVPAPEQIAALFDPLPEDEGEVP